jgi:hypothetical protein
MPFRPGTLSVPIVGIFQNIFFRSLMTNSFEGRLDAEQVLRRIEDLLRLPPMTSTGGWAGLARRETSGPLPDPWRRSIQDLGESLIRAAQVKSAAEMAGNKDLSRALDPRIQRMLDDDTCPIYIRIIKIPKEPYPPDPPPRPNWLEFEELVAVLLQAQAGLQDGQLKQELGGIIAKVAGPG